LPVAFGDYLPLGVKDEGGRVVGGLEEGAAVFGGPDSGRRETLPV